ncbi:MAG TPA: outer membrane beta-barrel protein [Niastella sp.]|nr:outer membrane beta-barrel protein [Niastella sp.]
MKKVIFAALISFTAFYATAQTAPADLAEKEVKKLKPKVGIKAGYNFTKVVGSKTNYKPQNHSGFMVSGFYATPSKGLGYRTELIFSRQGFSFDDAGKMQSVSQSYVYMPHLTTFTIAKTVQLQAGGQVGYLLNAKKEADAGNEEEKIIQYMNRIDYGVAAGIEVYPFKGTIIGARYNVSLGSMYKRYNEPTPGFPPPTPFPLPFDPSEFKGKNAVVQFFIGYRF